MAPRAIARLGAHVFVWAVAAHAATRSVHHDGRGMALRSGMATHAISRAEVAVGRPAIGDRRGSVRVTSGVFQPAI